MAKPRASLFDDFERVIDEFFDEMLIGRWRAGGEFERAAVLDRGDHYEVRIEAAHIDPAHIEVEVSDHRLTARVPSPQGEKVESSFRFADEIENEHAGAHWSAGVLTITLPKKKGRRVTLKHS
ncbi:MAG TPA: Hsp20/alpha crystallin family protein [Candidatus Binataceae bacterium]|nr:Hsp20/alpha crystallin family protein [Candidatus Binataceae bacterium]